MSSNKLNAASPGSWNHTRPARSHTYRRPLFSKLSPTASFQIPSKGPGMTVSVKPAGSVAAKSSPKPADHRQNTAMTINHAIAVGQIVEWLRSDPDLIVMSLSVYRRSRLVFLWWEFTPKAQGGNLPASLPWDSIRVAPAVESKVPGGDPKTPRPSGSVEPAGKRELLLGHVAGRALHVVRQNQRAVGAGVFLRNPHAVKRAIHEDQRNNEEERANSGFGTLIFHGHGDFHGEQTEQGGEFDHRIHRHGRRVLKRIAHGVADDRRRVEVRPLLPQIHFDDFLGVVPRAAGVGHEDGLKQSEEGDADQVADEEIRVE